MTRLPGGSLTRSGVGALRYRLTGHRMPLAVTCVVTHRCDALCSTCALPLDHRIELDTRQWVGLIDEIAARGGVRIGFSGGEPLVREDLPALVARAAEHGMWTTLETNGYRLPARLPELSGLRRVMIGLEGPEDVHDGLREPGAWVRVQAALAAAAEHGIERATVTTLTARNLDAVDWVLDHAEKTGTEATFQILQPGQPWVPRSAARLAPEPDALRRTLRRLVEARAAGRPVAMSEKLLRYLLAWPDYRASTSVAPREDVHCVAGQLHCAIEPDGAVVPCTLLSRRFPGGNVRDGGFAAAFERLRDNGCRACTSTPLTEYNFLFNLDASALYERARGYLAARTVPQ